MNTALVSLPRQKISPSNEDEEYHASRLRVSPERGNNDEDQQKQGPCHPEKPKGPLDESGRYSKVSSTEVECNTSSSSDELSVGFESLVPINDQSEGSNNKGGIINNMSHSNSHGSFTSLASSSNNNNNNNQKSKNNNNLSRSNRSSVSDLGGNLKLISFDNEVRILEFNTIIGDNPGVSGGCPIALGHHLQTTRYVSLRELDYEHSKGKGGDAPKLSFSERAKILHNAGFSVKDIAAATYEALRSKEQRRKTNKKRKWDSFHGFVESVQRKVKKLAFSSSSQKEKVVETSTLFSTASA